MDKRVAIIGSAFRLPSTNSETLWEDLMNQKDLITEVDPSRWNHNRFLHPDKKHPGTSYTFSAGSIGDVSGFDAQFFGISNREAAIMDPQQRLLLEMTWEALENAGVKPSRMRGSETGVYIGIASADYSYRMANDLSVISTSVATGNTASIAANRISYAFDFKGPSIAMDTACSSSLVAFHQACQAIRNGEISQAVTGGVSLHLHPYGFISFSKATMLSPDGRCKVFDKDGNGYVRSEGGGIFLLKDYEMAVADGDSILAVVAGSAVNTDGYKSGLTVPSADAQVALMEKVCEQTGLSPEDFDYLEAHGTGTAVGDPIETHAIGQAIGQKRQEVLPIGSVKGNMGHLETASGVAGMVKAIYSLQNRVVPPTIGMTEPNPNIRFQEWNIQPVTEAIKLPEQKTLTIGVNSFGFGGANAHVILQTPPAVTTPDTPVDLEKQLPFVLSGQSEAAVKQAASELAELLRHSETALYDTAYQLRFKRDLHSEGCVVFASSRSEATVTLKRFAQEASPNDIANVYTGKCLPSNSGQQGKPVFVFSGNGCQWERMGDSLLKQSPIFRDKIEEIDLLFKEIADFSLVDEMQVLNGSGRMEYTEVAQPTLFALQMGIVEVLRSEGITPSAVVGHSVGEIAAACVSGALSLKDAVSVIYHRSQLQGLTKGKGKMTAVGLSVAEIGSIIEELDLRDVCIAGDNSNRGSTVAGEPEQLTLLENKLAADAVFFRRLDLDYAFHSPVMDEIHNAVLEKLKDLTPQHTTCPFFSTVSGQIEDGPNLTADYWWKNIREPVQFQMATTGLIDNEGHRTFIEIGGHPVLRSYVRDGLKSADTEGLIIPTLERQNDNPQQLTATIAATLLSGASIDESNWFPVTGQPVSLPNYPWQKATLWHPVTAESTSLLDLKIDHPLLGTEIPQQQYVWENVIDTGKFSWLSDHVVGESVVFPGTGYLEVLLAAAGTRDSETLELEDIEITLPMILSDGASKKIRTSISSDGRTVVSSRPLAEEGQWSQNAKGRIIEAPTGEYLKIKRSQTPNRKADFTSSDHLEMTQYVGLNYGPGFQAIDKGWREGNRVIGWLKSPESIIDSPYNPITDYYLHPALMDCGLQLIIHLMSDQLNQNEG